MDADAHSMTVEVVYARPEQQVLMRLRLPLGATVAQAIAASGLLERFSEIDLTRNRVGVFSRLVELDAVLQAGDRVEIYRPLQFDPKESRRRRAARKA